MPGKVMADIGGRPALSILLQHARRAGYPVAVAIPAGHADDPLVDLAAQSKVSFYRGQDDSPLHSIRCAARELGPWDHVIRCTTDDVLLDPDLLRAQVNAHLAADADYTYCADCPEGVAAEVVSAKLLDRCAEECAGPVEYCSHEFRRHAEKVLRWQPPEPYRHRYRLTLDWPEDLTVLRVVFSALAEPFTTLDVLNLLRHKRNWYLARLNAVPDVSVWTCCHNQSRYLDQCMDSVVKQSGVEWEYVVVDDGSTDETAATMLAWYTRQPEDVRRRVRLVRFDPNRGLPGASNAALSWLRAPRVVRVDSDDFLLPGALQRMVRAHEKAGKGVLFTDYLRCSAEGVIESTPETNDERHPGCCIMDRQAAIETGFDESLAHYEGREFMGRFVPRFGEAGLREPLWVYRRNPEGKTLVPEIPAGQVLVQVVKPRWKTFGKFYDVTGPKQTIAIKLQRPKTYY